LTNKKSIILFFPLIESKEKFSNIPWALLSLERMVRHLEVEVILIDERLEPDYDHILERYSDSVLFAGISAVIGYQIAGGVKFADTFRKYSKAPVIWGGWFPTTLPEPLLKDGYADYVCTGPGELPFKNFTEKMLQGLSVKDIPGIGFVENDEVILNPNGEYVNPELSFPPVNKDLIDVNRLIDINGPVPIGSRFVDYLASTGCPNGCGFCSVVHVYRHRWFAKQIPEIMEDLWYFKQKANISHVVFWDENIFASKRFVMEFCNELIRSGIALTWSGYAHIGYFLRNFSDEEIALVYKAGCREIRLGAESGDQEVLDLIHKKIKVDDTLKVVTRLKKHKIRSRIFLIACFPQDPDKDFWLTLNLMGRALLVDPTVYAKIRFFVPIPKTDLYELSMQKGFIPPTSTLELIHFFNYHFTVNYTAPWCKKDYSKTLEYYENFYFLFTDPYCYRKFPTKHRPLIILLSLWMVPVVWLRIRWNIMKFPFEAKLLAGIVKRLK
jgi:radical SAM superfamily enzyme YgiQ (UPF0313 family)